MNGFAMPLDTWNADFDALHPCFQQLQNRRCWVGLTHWPACDCLNQLLPAALCAQSGLPLRFFPQDNTLPLGVTGSDAWSNIR